MAVLRAASLAHPRVLARGMATHVLAGAAVGSACFARLHRKPFLELADTLVIPGALLMGLGRISNSSTAGLSAASPRCRGESSFPTPSSLATLSSCRRREEPAARALPAARSADEPDAGRRRRAIRLLVRVSTDLHRPRARLSHASAGAGHRADVEPRDSRPGCRAPIRSRLRRLGRLRLRAEPTKVAMARAQQRPRRSRTPDVAVCWRSAW